MPYKDPEKRKQYVRQYQKDHSAQVKEATKRYRKKHPQVRNPLKDDCIALYKQILGCHDCEDHLIGRPEALDLDHRPGTDKLFTFAHAAGHSLENIIREAEKCDVVCANCHRTRTVKRLVKDD